MYLRKVQTIFLHVPKAAGGTVERAWTGKKIKMEEETNLEFLLGWSDEHRLWLQHATPNELVVSGLIRLRGLNFVTVVRHPYERLISSYFWFKKKGVSGSVMDFLKRRGPFNFLLPTGSKESRHHHWLPQSRWLESQEKAKTSTILRLESMGSNLVETLSQHLSTPETPDPPRVHEGRKRQLPASCYLQPQELKFARGLYGEDFQNFEYEDDGSRFQCLSSRISYFFNFGTS